MMLSLPGAEGAADTCRRQSVKEDNRGNGAGRLSSVASALRLLKTFSGEEAEIGISSLAKRLGVAKSTVHRLATTLVSEGFLEQNPDNGRYHLGLTLFVLGAEMRN
ncbi:MAG: helix-turn-helix domain-containing protein, partial [Bradyrhizobium sp.]